MSKGASILGQNQNASLWKRLGYSAKKGWELAKKAVSGAVGFIGKCARYVKNAISKAGLGKLYNWLINLKLSHKRIIWQR